MRKILTISLMLVVLFAFFACTESKTAEKPATTSIAITGKNSGGGTDADLKWTEVELATLDVTEGNDGFAMSPDVKVDTASGESKASITITGYNSSTYADGDDITDSVDLTLSVGGQTGAWTLKSAITAKEDATTQKDLNDYTSYKVEISGPLFFTCTIEGDEQSPVTGTASISYERVTATIISLTTTNSGNITQATEINSKGIAKFTDYESEGLTDLSSATVTFDGTVTMNVNNAGEGPCSPEFNVDSAGQKINMTIPNETAPAYDASAANTIVFVFTPGAFKMDGASGAHYAAKLTEEYTFKLNVTE